MLTSRTWAEQLDGAPVYRTLARRIVSDHLAQLALGRYGVIAQALSVTRQDVIGGRELIRTRLRPYPMLPAAAGGAVPAAAPEIIVHESGGVPGAFTVELLEPRRLGLGISPPYERLDPQTLAPRERERTEANLTRARFFLQRLDRRWTTMVTVVQAVVQRQRAFLLTGPAAMVPLTRRQIADDIGVHESTVSRVIRGRHALLPSRRVIPLDAFFDAAAGARDALARTVAAEERPLSDSELAVQLSRVGFPMARRTVAKYREQLGIPAHAGR